MDGVSNNGWIEQCTGCIPRSSIPHESLGHFTVINYSEVIMSAVTSQITWSRLFTQPFVRTQIKKNHQRSVSLAFVREIHRWPVISPHKGPVTRKMFPFNDVIMIIIIAQHAGWDCNIRISLERPVHIRSEIFISDQQIDILYIWDGTNGYLIMTNYINVTRNFETRIYCYKEMLRKLLRSKQWLYWSQCVCHACYLE